MTAAFTLWLDDLDHWHFAQGTQEGSGRAALAARVAQLGGNPPAGVEQVRADSPHAGAQAAGAAGDEAEALAAVLLLPAERVLATEARVPARTRRQLARALPFAVEEKLAIDLDSAHIATGALLPNESTRVRVVERTYLEGALALAGAMGLRAESVFADADCVPVEGDLALLIDARRVLLRDRAGRSLAFARAVLPLVFAAACRPLRSDAAEPLTATAYVVASAPLGELERSALESELAGTTQRGALRVEPVVSALGVLAGELASADRRARIDLLQGRYAPARSLGLDWRRWKPAALAAVVLICMQPALDAGKAWRYGKDAARVDAEATRMYRDLFPGEPVPRDVRRAFERRLGTTHGEALGVRPMMAALAGALAKTQGFELQSVSYQRERDELSVQLLAGSLGDLERFKGAFAAEHLAADVSSAEQEDNRVRARLRVHGAARAGDERGER